MLHFLTAGYFDEAAVEQVQLQVLRPLDPQVLDRLLNQFRDRDTAALTFEGKPVTLKNGCVRVPWYSPGLNVTSLKFLLALHAETGCVMADLEHGRMQTPAYLATLLPK
jgi:hypothetical protein